MHKCIQVTREDNKSAPDVRDSACQRRESVKFYIPFYLKTETTTHTPSDH